MSDQIEANDVAQAPVIVYGDYKIAIPYLPDVSARRLMQSGLAHILGNECASRVTSQAKAWLAEKGAEATDEQRATWLKDARGEAFERLLAGTIADRRPRAATLPPLERIMHDIARGRVQSVLASMKGPDGKPVRLTKLTDTLNIYGPSGAVTATRTLAELIDRQIAYEAGSAPVKNLFGGKTVKAEAEAKLRAMKSAEAKAGEAESLEEML